MERRTLKNIFVTGINAKGIKKIINAAGLKESYLQNFYFSNVSIEGKSAGDVSYAANWLFDNVVLTGLDGKKLNVATSTEMSLQHN